MPIDQEVSTFEKPVAGQNRFVRRAWPPNGGIISDGNLKSTMAQIRDGRNPSKLFNESVFSSFDVLGHGVARLPRRPV